MKKIIGHWSLTIGFLLAGLASAWADGGVVISQTISGPYRITLFGAPSPLRAGPADLSVLVQDIKTDQAVLDSQVKINVQAASQNSGEAWVPPCCSMKTSGKTVAATHEAAQNKLLYAANTIIPASGPHEISVRLNDQSVLSAKVEIAPALPPLSHYWSCLAFPPLAILGFALNQRLRRRR